MQLSSYGDLMTDSEIDTLIDTLLTLPAGWLLKALARYPDGWEAHLEHLQRGRLAVGFGSTARAAIEMAKSEAAGKDLEDVR